MEENLSPMVSIITPSYNSKEFFEETFKSVINQTFENWEWIIIDDSSTDGSYDFIKKTIKKNPKIKLYKTSKNVGAARARNLGIEKATGRYISFLDSDDLWKSNKLKLQVDFVLKNNVPFCYCDYDVLLANEKVKKFKIKKSNITYKVLLKKCDIGCLTVMYDSLILGKIYMSENAPKREDYATWLKLAKEGVRMVHLSENVAVYRIHNSGISFNKFKLIKYHWNVYRKCEKLSALKSLFYLICFSLHKMFLKY